MKLTEYIAGSDIPAKISIYTDSTKTTKYNLDDFLEIIIYMYTALGNIKKFSKTVKTGYIRLIRIDSETYQAILEGAVNKDMANGVLKLEVFTATTAVEITTGRLKSMGYVDLCTFVQRPITVEQ